MATLGQSELRRTLTRVAFAILAVAAVLPIVAGPLGLGAAPLPAPGTPVTIPGGYRLNVLDQGTGPAVLLVHGLPGSAYDWEPLSDLLRAAGCRVIRYDRVGYGHSDRRRDDGEHRVDVNGIELARADRRPASPSRGARRVVVRRRGGDRGGRPI